MIGIRSRLHLSLPALFLLVALTVVATSDSSAQFYFGKNKVNYTDFDWQVMSTEHFKIYFYTEAEEIAMIAAREAEDSYEVMAIRFSHEVRRTIPLIIYSAPSYFSQTNILPHLIPEAVGGVTEFMKGRVVVPFNGNYHDFAHVIRHEIVHVFQLSKMSAVIDRHSRLRLPYPPLWFIEGQAEYWSKDWDTDADMFVKDFVLTNNLPSIPNMYVVHGTYYMYKLGESICRFISEYYGEDKLLRIYENMPKGRSFDNVIKITLGEDLAEVSTRWEYWLKKQYYPEIEELDLPRMEAERITLDGYAMQAVPITWDDGSGEQEWIVYQGNRLGYSGLYMKPAHKGKDKVRTLVKGERSSHYESLHLFRSSIDAVDEGLIVFSAKSKERDVLNIYDLNRKKVVRRFQWDHIVAIRSPRFAPGAKKVVFSGVQKNGISDLYELDMLTGDAAPLTSDFYYDMDPAYSPDGSYVVFSSDRGIDGERGGLNLFRLDLASGDVSQLTFGFYRDESPEVTERGIYFSSDREGSFNLFHLGADSSLTRQSTYVTGAFDPRISSDGMRLCFTGYQATLFQVFMMDVPKKPEPVTQDVSLALANWYPEYIAEEHSATTVNYETRYSFDIAQSAIVYDPVYGSAGGLQIGLSDMLGNHSFQLLLANTAESNDELLTSFNVGITYVNQENRLNWAVGAFHLFYERRDEIELFYDEREAGVLGLISYPLSKFHRIEFSNFLRYSKRSRFFGFGEREAFLMTNYLRLVYDNTLWDISGPIEGRRYNFTIGITTGLDKGENFNRQAIVDLRHYFRLGRQSAFANRMFAFTSDGPEPQRIYFGGSWSFRGFDRREWYVRNILFMSNELRFPLINNLFIGFPIGTLGFRGIRGALFYDTGAAWEDEFDRFLASFGFGFRVAVGPGFILRFDFARTTDYQTISRGFDFDFFFGWNF